MSSGSGEDVLRRFRDMMRDFQPMVSVRAPQKASTSLYTRGAKSNGRNMLSGNDHETAIGMLLGSNDGHF